MTAPTLDSVPDDVVLEIWSHLDDPTALSQVSKRFHAFSKLAFLRARWFCQRFPPYLVLFEAIARPKLLNSDLLDRLFRAGAPYSRSLVHLLLYCTASTVSGMPFNPQVRWAHSLSFDVFAALISKARELYGDSLTLQQLPHDEAVLEQWLRQQQRPPRGDESNDDIPPHIIALLRDFKTMPLPLRIDYESFNVVRSGARKVEDALVQEPRLAPLYVANGYRTSAESFLYMSTKILWHSSDNALRAADKMRELQDQAMLGVPRSCAVEVASLLTQDESSAARADRAKIWRATIAYDALKQLSPQLTFDLEAVVREAFDGIKYRLIRLSDLPLLQVIDRDYPCIDVRPAYVQAMFLRANLDKLTGSADLDVIATMMGRHEVRTSDVLQACLRQECRSAMPLRYAARFINGFQLEPVLVALVEAILHQPYRGLMLRALYWLCAPTEPGCPATAGLDFPSLLAQAVERKAFTANQLPAQLWTKSLDAKTNKEVYACNAQQPVRSLLSFSWKSTHESYRDIDGRGVPRSELANGPTTLRSFTRFIPLHAPNVVSQVLFENEAHEEVWYESYSEDDNVALAIVDLLGPQSRAADIVLAHSFLNTNDALTERLLKLGVSPTLAHIKIALRVGRTFPDAVDECIAYGAPFKASFESPDGHPDRVLETELASTKLTEEETSRCLAARESEREARVLVDVDESGQLRIQKIEDALDTPFVEQILTGAPSAAVATQSTSALAVSEADAIANPDASTFLLYLDGIPTLVTASQLVDFLSTLRLWVRHLQRLEQMEHKKRAALRIALQCSDPFEGFHKASRFGTATGHLPTVIAELESWIEHLRNSESIDQLEPTKIELAHLYEELRQAEGVKAVQRTCESVIQHLKMGFHDRRHRDCRRRSYTRGLHAIRRAQDSWSEILDKAKLAPSNEDLLDPDFEPEEGSSSSSSSESEDEDEDGVLESQRSQRRQSAHSSIQASPSSSSMTDRGSSSNQAGLLTRRRARDQSQQQAIGSSSSSHGNQLDSSSAVEPLEEQRHPVYAHPLFNAEEFERLSKLASEVGQRQEVTEDRYEETLMCAEVKELTEEKRWGSPSQDIVARHARLLSATWFNSDVKFTPHWLPAHLRADIYRKPL